MSPGPTMFPLSILVLASGDFGNAVSTCLVQMIGARVADALTPPEAWPEAQFRMLITGRRLLELETILDTIAFERREAWFPVLCRQPVVELGPIVDPGFGPCLNCAKLRQSQHDYNQEARMLLDTAYERCGSTGPSGYLPAHVSLVAAIAWRAIEYWLVNRTNQVGIVRTIDLTSLRLGRGTVVGLHGCPRCGRRAAKTYSAK